MATAEAGGYYNEQGYYVLTDEEASERFGMTVDEYHAWMESLHEYLATLDDKDDADDSPDCGV